MKTKAIKALLALALASAMTGANAAPVKYDIDPDHTYPSFEADHMGISVWRGKFNKTTGTMTLDKEAGEGGVDVTIDLSSVDFGQDQMNEEAVSTSFFDVANHPTATYTGRLSGFKDGAPSRVVGDLTLHGVTRPVELKINTFKCIPHPLHKRELCGADAVATFQRDAFGLDAGKDHGFDMSVTVRIQMEAVAAE